MAEVAEELQAEGIRASTLSPHETQARFEAAVRAAASRKLKPPGVVGHAGGVSGTP